MYFKLALRNVKKSFKDFLVYFLTLTFSVCLFYTFNSFQSQQAVMKLNSSQLMIVDQLSLLMRLVSIFVAVVLAFLILYANNFLIRRRKKELGLYTMLGMPRGKISRILVYETLTIGIVSLISGMVLGLIVSQVLTAVTANLFAVPLDYHFVFSPSATIMTVFSFSMIFFITMIFNTMVLNRYKLIDLLNADRRNDDLKIKKVWMSLLLFVISIACLGWAYYQALDNGIMAFNSLGSIILVGSIGTVFFFLSLAGFLLTVVKSSKGIYFKNLNCFILRQINSNINTNFISMSIVCIMLLLSIGSLSTGLSLNNTMNKSIKNNTPYDYTLIAQYGYYPNGSKRNEEDIPLQDAAARLQLNPSYIKSQSFITTYTPELTVDDKKLIAAVSDSTGRQLIKSYTKEAVVAIPLSSYNTVRKRLGYDTIQLKNNEIYLYTSVETISTAVNEILDAKPEVTVFGNKVRIANDSYDSFSLGTNSSMNGYLMAIVVPDALIPKQAEINEIYWNIDLTSKINCERFDSYIEKQISTLVENHPNEQQFPAYMRASKQDVYDMNKGMAVTFTYIGIYLGTVFMIASAVILALQQLSQANDNKKRYLILNKIGTEQRMINRSILLQIAIYFMMPLALAIVHSIVGIKMVNTLVIMFGRGDIMTSSMFTAAIILVIYGSYFLVTYAGYKNILKS
ncbi:ABC transporter permease [Erysipelotrichaceae bacterium AF15-26LB]|nr:FtsX-like permease family protein [[Clostridium] innocuum]RJV89031.1 ABC transporter permease [Erysipelotrichaceae bacterium AF19-24AC]RJV91440.1 ABC transporter permease [Erysipelotrichaceae bacterium AF15-26LB]